MSGNFEGKTAAQRQKSSQKGRIVQDSKTDEFDRADYRILSELSRDARISDVSLGDRVHLSSTAVSRRRRALEASGVITGYGAQLNYRSLGLGVVAIVSIELNSQEVSALLEFEDAVGRSPSMSFCCFVSGDTDFVIILHVESLQSYNDIYRNELSVLPHVAKIRSSFVLKEVSWRRFVPSAFNGRV